MPLPTIICPECGQHVDARKHNLKAHRRTHGAKGSNPVVVPDALKMDTATTPERTVELPREEFKLR